MRVNEINGYLLECQDYNYRGAPLVAWLSWKRDGMILGTGRGRTVKEACEAALADSVNKPVERVTTSLERAVASLRSHLVPIGRYKVSSRNGERETIYHVVDTQAPEGEQPAIVRSYSTLQHKSGARSCAEYHAECLNGGGFKPGACNCGDVVCAETPGHCGAYRA